MPPSGFAVGGHGYARSYYDIKSGGHPGLRLDRRTLTARRSPPPGWHGRTEGGADMVGAWYDPILIPITCMISLAFLIAAVVWAAYHPEWKDRGGTPGARSLPPSVLHNRTWLDTERDLGSGKITQGHEDAPGHQHEEAPAQRRDEAPAEVTARR
jgi:hypothetical protein